MNKGRFTEFTYAEAVELAHRNMLEGVPSVSRVLLAELDTLRQQLAVVEAEVTELRQQKADWAADASIAADDKAQRRAITELYNQATNEKTEAQIKAFVEGAKWWEWHTEKATMWLSDQQLAYDQAKKRYPGNTP